MGRVALLVFTSLVLPLLAAEAVLRWQQDGGFSRKLYEIDPLLGWRLAPGHSHLFTEEGRGLVETNSRGFRDSEHALRKDERLRVVLLGDSFFEGKQVDVAQSVAVQLERHLLECLQGAPNAPQSAEVLNFSVQGYGTVQQYLLFAHEAAAFNPDVVVLGFYEGNDVVNNHPLLNPTNAELAPYLHSPGSGLLPLPGQVQIKPPADTPLRTARLGLAVVARHSLVAQKLLAVIADYVKKDPLLSESEYEWVLLREPIRAELADAWRDTENLLRAFHSTVEATGAKFLVASIPAAIVVHPDAQQRRDFQRRYAIADFRYPLKRLSALQVPLLDLAAPLAAAAQRQKAVYGFANSRPGYGHWNELGHDAAAAAIATWVCDNAVITGKSGRKK